MNVHRERSGDLEKSLSVIHGVVGTREQSLAPNVTLS